MKTAKKAVPDVQWTMLLAMVIWKSLNSCMKIAKDVQKVQWIGPP
jgi:hypothetical protein